MTVKVGNHTFSIEMASRRHLMNVVISEDNHEGVLIEGALGELEEIALHEDSMLEIRGSNSTLRLDIARAQLEGCLVKKGKRRGGKEE